MEIVKSSLEQQVEEHTEQQSRVEQAKALVKKKIAFAKRQLSGALTYAEFKTLSKAAKIGYVKRFGYPKTDGEKRGAAQRSATSKKRNKIARKSRATNRSR